MQFERKIKLSFLKLFDNSLSKYLICKRIFACNGYFELFNKIKMGSGYNFWCTFSAWFFHTNAPDLILYQLTKFQRHIFLQDIKQNVLLSSYLDN